MALVKQNPVIEGRDGVSDEFSDFKVGVSLADKITEEINAAGWPVGKMLGVESELMIKYSVSRGALREAIRLVEQQGIAEMKRGRGGGLQVTAPDDCGVVKSMVNYLTFRRILPEHLLEARRAVEISLLPMVIDRMSNENERRLRQFLAEESQQVVNKQESVRVKSRGFHTLLSSMSGNPALDLFVRVIEKLVNRAYFARRSESEHAWILAQVHRRHVEVANAIIAKDLPLAVRLFDELLTYTAAFYSGD